MEKMRSLLDKKVTPYILLTVLIIVQLCYTTYMFAFVKQGVSSDEPWSYGLANSYYRAQIFLKPDYSMRQVGEETLDNFNEWTDGSVYWEYITVQEDERFAYDSVIDNQQYDYHPPFYYILLHTICSFFPETFSYYYGYVINVISLVIVQIFLYKCLKLLTGSRYFPFLGCILYAAGYGALSTFILIRMYCMLAAICMVFTYFNVKLYRSDFENFKGTLPVILISAFLGFATAYTFIVYVGIMTACMCVYMLCKKRIKKMFIYGGSVLAALILFFALYPVGVKQILERPQVDRTLSWSVFTEFKMYISLMTANLFGFRINTWSDPSGSYVVAAVVLLAAVCVPLCFLFRNESRFKRFVSNVRAVLKRFLNCLGKFDFILLFIILSSLAFIAAYACSTTFLVSGKSEIRYLFVIFPCACAAAVVLLRYVFSWIPKLKKYTPILVAAAVGVMVVRTHILAKDVFLNKQSEDYTDLSKVIKDKNCVVVLSEVIFLPCYLSYIMNADNVFNTLESDFEENLEAIDSIDGTVDYVILNVVLEEDEVDEEKSSLEIADDVKLSSSSKTLDGYFEKLSQLNGGCEPELVYKMNVQGGTASIIRLT